MEVWTRTGPHAVGEWETVPVSQRLGEMKTKPSGLWVSLKPPKPRPTEFHGKYFEQLLQAL